MRTGSLLNILTFMTLLSCGNKSTIKNAVKPVTLAESYGDGKFIYPEPFLAITDIDQYDSSVPNAGPLLSGIARAFMGIGLAASRNLGQATMSLVQPVPEIPREYVKDIRLKRVFFYIEPKVGGVRRCKFWGCVFEGKGNVDFNFLGRLAIVIKPHHLERRSSWIPSLNNSEKITKTMEEKYENLFEEKSLFPAAVNSKKDQEITIIKYDKNRTIKTADNKKISEYIRNDEYGAMFIFKSQNANSAVEVRDFLKDHPVLREQIEEVYILEESVMVQLKKDSIVTATFQAVINLEKIKLDELKVDYEECTPQTCIDLKIPDVSLIDIVTKDNAIKLEAFMEAADVPETFRLKGFIEFKTKVKPPI